jgi:hypothetical protein
VAGRLRRAAATLGLHVARRRSYDLVARNYYSPIPDESALPPDVRARRSELRGIDFNTERQIAWAERELYPYVLELKAPETRTKDSDEFFFQNTTYEHGDAELAYAMVRRFAPARVVELGSGFSTLVLGRAATANRDEGHHTRLEVNDPYPRVADWSVRGLSTLSRRPAESIPTDELEGLEPHDLLFVDTTHVVKLGGDVNHIILDVLPALAPGVLVHFHDIWLPYEYHPDLTKYHGVHWTEQYLLQALLCGNDSFEVLFATHAVDVEQPERVRRLLPGYTGGNHPTSFWLRRAGSR